MGLSTVATGLNKQRHTQTEKQQTASEIEYNKENAKGSAKIGNTFEKELEATLEVYRQMGVAYIQKFTPPVVYIPDKYVGGVLKKGFMMHKAKVGFDYMGGIIHTNTPVMIEAKSTWESRIDVYHEKHGIKAHQLETMSWLEQNTKFEVFFLWQVRKMDAIVYKFTPSKLLEAIGEKKSLTANDCEDFRFPKMLKQEYRGIRLYDFLYLLE